jgi:hypothetical protein
MYYGILAGRIGDANLATVSASLTKNIKGFEWFTRRKSHVE